MILSAHQPSYIPWLGFIHKLDICDTFVSMDDVKFSKNSMYARNFIKINNKKIMLTVPTNKSDKNKIIKDVKIFGTKWAEDHLKKIKLGYSKSEFYKIHIEKLENIYKKKWTWLCDLNHEFLFFIKDLFKIETKIIVASKFYFEGNKNTRLINYCNKFKANKYIFGKNGKNYFEESEFKKNNISVFFQNFDCINENLSFIDYLFNFGTNLFWRQNEI